MKLTVHRAFWAFTIVLTVMLLPTIVQAGTKECSWDHPGANRFTGDVREAIRSYKELTPGLRERLAMRAEVKAYDEVVVITRDAIIGEGAYDPGIRRMHFGGNGKVCDTVSRERWKATDLERGLVYCEGEVCVLVPTVCTNVSLIKRTKTGDPQFKLLDVPPTMQTQEGPAHPLSSYMAPLGPLGDTPDTFAMRADPYAPNYYQTHGPGAWGGGRGSQGSPGGGDNEGEGTTPPVRPGTPGQHGFPPPPLTPVPEPSTWATLAAGLVVIIWKMRRNRWQPQKIG